MQRLFESGSGAAAHQAKRRRMCGRLLLWALISNLLWLRLPGGGTQAAESLLQLQVGDRIAILGNGLADRMQHDGWLETLLQARFPARQLVVRHLGFTGDELTVRLRSQDFGSPADWLERTQATIVFAFFGYNESFRGVDGLAEFKQQLADFVTRIRSTDGAGDRARRLVLFSPIAYEDLGNPLLPAAGDFNRRLLAYTRAMAEVAEQLGVTLVDLFHPSAELYRQFATPLTINGIHLNEAGNRAIAEVADRALFGETDAAVSTLLPKLRDAVRDKNFYWFQRYRATDGYSIFGGRKGAGGSQWTPDNQQVMEREMEVLDVMTAHRDERIWALARGQHFTVDDSDTPPLIPVASNKPGPLEDGSYPFLGAEAAIDKMTVAKGLAVNLFASEEEFPELQNPVQSAVDTKGRLWVAAWPSYPHWNPQDEMNDKLLILADTDQDGRADQCKVFADGLHNPTGFEFYDGGVYVAQVPDVWFFQDTNGDDVADVRQRVVGGIDSADTHHSLNSFVIGPGGGLYFQEGIFHRTQIETPHGPPVRVGDAGVFRYDPRSQEMLVHANYRFANPHGHVFTYWGDDIIHDGTSATPLFGPSISGRMIYPAKHASGPEVYSRRTRPCSATAILSSGHFPPENRDTLLVCNVIGVQGVLQYRLQEEGAGLQGVEMEPLLLSSDPNFRPVDLEVGSDGAVYLLDWQNPLIGHLQHNLRDSNRDHLHGRVYRIRCQDRELLRGPAIADQPLHQLFALLENRDNGVRYRAKLELSRRPAQQVAEACQSWIGTLDARDPDYEHHLLEALWVHQHHHLTNEPLLRRLLGSENHRVRAAAAHVLRAWRPEIAAADVLVEQLVHDEHPRVRLAGVLICSDIDSSESAELALEAAQAPRDRFLDYVVLDTCRTLAPIWKQALAAGKPFGRDNPAGIDYLLKCSSAAELFQLAPHDYLLGALITHPDAEFEVRLQVLTKLAHLRGVQPLPLLLDLIKQQDAAEPSIVPQLVELLASYDRAALRSADNQLLPLATEGSRRATRRGALAALARIDRSADRAWQLAGGTSRGLIDLLESVELIPEKQIRALFYDRVRPIMRQPTINGTPPPQEQVLAKIINRAVDAMGHIPGHEQQKLNDLIVLLEQDRCRASAVAAIRTIPPANWREPQAVRLVAATIKSVAAIAPADRASGAVFDQMQLALKFSALLPEEQRRQAQATLQGFGVKVLRLSTLPHRMAYDQEQMVVQAGGPVQLIFENQDDMPHNFVLTRPGTMERIGLQAESEATQPDTIARHYVPRSGNVLLASRLLQPHERQTLDFQAPRRPGVYPYVCTYPGHWRRMFGALYVVADVEQYAANPSAYLAAHPLTVQDELLKYNRPLRQWTFAELRPALDRLATERSFARGKTLFEVASCAACHTVKGEQSRFAPDLAQLDPERQPADLLRAMLEPSQEINEKYQTSQFVMDTGKSVVGFVVAETASEVTLMVDPLASCAPVVLAKSEIEERYQSKISLMPVGLLDRLTEEEILELVAYVVARGDSDAPVYHPANSH